MPPQSSMSRLARRGAEKPRCRPGSPLVLCGILCLPAMLGSCDNCYAVSTDTVQSCQQSGAFTATVPSSFVVACAPKLGWTGYLGRSFFTIETGCSTDDDYWVSVPLPPGAGAATYSLPSTVVPVSASFGPATPPPSRGVANPRPTFSTSQYTLRVTSGTIVVHSNVNYGASSNQDNYGIDVDATIELEASAGDRFSIAGHLVESACVLTTTTGCMAD